jgi:transposase
LYEEGGVGFLLEDKLVFLPPYSPELNPAEKMWARLKRVFTNKLYKSLEEICLFIENVTKEINRSTKRHQLLYIANRTEKKTEKWVIKRKEDISIIFAKI